ncbi:hypothetical protein [Bacillus sp. 1P06AnD]|uniref:hypothetical protein n=1 Tax=Bacillus sp. 1P06AnD TaxID=3132208 RepID=UPI00399F0128
MTDLYLIIFLGALLFALTNLIVYFFAKGKKRMILAGIFILLLSPFVFWGTLIFVSNYDKGGFGAAIFANVYGIGYFLNGIVILFSNQTK